MPTRRGVAVLLGGLVGVVLGAVFGLPEATALGAGAIALVGAAVLTVQLRGRAPAVRRTVRPPRVAVGDPCEVVLTVGNDGSRRTPPARLVDEVAGEATARFLVAPLAPGEQASSTYELATSRRGAYRIGPLHARVGGPFGLARLDEQRDGTSTVVVLPRVVPLPPLPAAVGDEPELGTRSMVAVSTVDEEFTGLRGYVPGDDVRRIHWPSSARAGDALVRQFEVPWQRRTTLVVDLRADHHDPWSFERTVTAAASVVALAAAGSELLRLGTDEQPDPPFVSAAEHLDAFLDRFALLAPVPAGAGSHGLIAAVERATASATGRLVVCTGAPNPGELDAVLRAASRAGTALVLTTAGEGPSRPTISAGGAVHVHWDGRSDLAAAWRDAGEALRAPGVGSR